MQRARHPMQPRQRVRHPQRPHLRPPHRKRLGQHLADEQRQATAPPPTVQPQRPVPVQAPSTTPPPACPRWRTYCRAPSWPADPAARPATAPPTRPRARRVGKFAHLPFAEGKQRRLRQRKEETRPGANQDHHGGKNWCGFHMESMNKSEPQRKLKLVRPHPTSRSRGSGVSCWLQFSATPRRT